MAVRCSRKKGLIPYYMCSREGIETASSWCQTISGAAIDRAIGKLLVELIHPDGGSAAGIADRLQRRARCEGRAGGVRESLDAGANGAAGRVRAHGLVKPVEAEHDGFQRGAKVGLAVVFPVEHCGAAATFLGAVAGGHPRRREARARGDGGTPACPRPVPASRNPGMWRSVSWPWGSSSCCREIVGAGGVGTRDAECSSRLRAGLWRAAVLRECGPGGVHRGAPARTSSIPGAQLKARSGCARPTARGSSRREARRNLPRRHRSPARSRDSSSTACR